MKIFIAGHKGLVGSALAREAQLNNYDILTRDRSELDLCNRSEVIDFMKEHQPNWVLIAAAKVGGIYANNTYPADFLLENLKIQNNLIEASYEAKIDKLLFLGSSCIFPKITPQPMDEKAILTGPLEKTNEAYSIAKISGIKLCNAYNKQYGTDFLCVMPSNLYGINDNYHPENAHALPMLIRRIHEAKEKGAKDVIVWGDGTPKREFMFADDLAEACFHLIKRCKASDLEDEFINIGTGKDVTIAALVETIKEIVGFEGKTFYDTSKPNGTPKKLLNVAKINSLGWKSKTSLKDGISKTYQDFLNNKKLRM